MNTRTNIVAKAMNLVTQVKENRPHAAVQLAFDRLAAVCEAYKEQIEITPEETPDEPKQEAGTGASEGAGQTEGRGDTAGPK